LGLFGGLEFFPDFGQVGFGFGEDFEDVLFVLLAEVGEVRIVGVVGEGVVEFVGYGFEGHGGEFVEGFGVDEPAAGVLKEAGIEVELEEGAAFGIFGSAFGKVFGETGGTADFILEGEFFGEEHESDELFGGIADAAFG